MARKKRSLNKRSMGTSIIPRNTNVTINTESPHYPTIQNVTCVLTPDNMREDQIGVPLYLDIGVLDVETCEPAPNVLLGLWHCNATGSYASFEALSPDTPFLELLDQLNITVGPNLDLHTSEATCLRDMWPTDSNGVIEMETIFPGFYVERSIHIHVQAHTNWTVRSNGTISASNIASTGQMYFEEEVSQKIMAMEPYAAHDTINRTTNDVDQYYGQGPAAGWEPIIQVEALEWCRHC
ncbi:aromatic compound dioxygenase [Byssothecium circinans]|uniref:Aromatic compound dioxygenase n=1 Tax=Byssothecium circinans TaxID=147558 RepID=A0A6A5TPD0_9PLEO|nr:aromatic compound dioxygenase [Byssothecium circinans]